MIYDVAYLVALVFWGILTFLFWVYAGTCALFMVNTPKNEWKRRIFDEIFDRKSRALFLMLFHVAAVSTLVAMMGGD